MSLPPFSRFPSVSTTAGNVKCPFFTHPLGEKPVNLHTQSNTTYPTPSENTLEMKEYTIRNERPEERRDVENLVRESFWNVYRPGCLEHFVLHVLRNDPAFIPELNLVMTLQDGGKERLIGQVVCMKAEIRCDDGSILPIMTLGPIGIHPDFQRQGFGKILLDHVLQRATEMGFCGVCFEGNIGFYGKSGFTYAADFGIRYHGLPEGADASFFLAKELRAGYFRNIRGEYATPQAYFVDESAADAFDRDFTPKEKLRLPGQLW